MNLQKSIKFLVFYLFLGGAWFLSCHAWALSADQKQPAHVTADRVIYQYKEGFTQFIGHVKMVQGSTELFADKVTSYTNEQGQIHKVIAIGKRARYLTLPDDQKQRVEVLGNTIEYYPLAQKAVVLGDAEIIQGSNRFHGEHVIYQLDKQSVTVLPVAGKPSVMVIQPDHPPGK